MSKYIILLALLSLNACQSTQNTADATSRNSSLFQIAGDEPRQEQGLESFDDSDIQFEKKLSSKNLEVTPLKQKSYRIQAKPLAQIYQHEKIKPVSKLPSHKHTPTLSKRDIQYLLKKLGYYNGKLDGHFGPQTTKAIRNFQRDTRLKSDGIAGKKTKSLLVSQVKMKYAKKYQSI